MSTVHNHGRMQDGLDGLEELDDELLTQISGGAPSKRPGNVGRSSGRGVRPNRAGTRVRPTTGPRTSLTKP